MHARLQSPIRTIVPTFLSDRSPVISVTQSQHIVAGLQQIGLVDANGQLTADPKDDSVRQPGGPGRGRLWQSAGPPVFS